MQFFTYPHKRKIIMRFYPLFLALSLFLNINLISAQNMDDPFATAGGQSVDAPFANMGELPDFKSFVAEHGDKVDVPYIMPFDLKSLMETRNRMFILDTRERHEFDVSHIQGSKCVGYEKFTVEKVWMLDRNTTIVVYSTDGERCQHVAAYLKMMGFIDVRRIEGSIIGWVNAGFSVVDREGHDTNNVFVNDKKEGKKLKKGKAVYEND
jgi:rhodanese-related sulfurtransferase